MFDKVYPILGFMFDKVYPIPFIIKLPYSYDCPLTAI